MARVGALERYPVGGVHAETRLNLLPVQRIDPPVGELLHVRRLPRLELRAEPGGAEPFGELGDARVPEPVIVGAASR